MVANRLHICRKHISFELKTFVHVCDQGCKGITGKIIDYVSSKKSNSAAYNVIDFLQYETFAKYTCQNMSNNYSL